MLEMYFGLFSAIQHGVFKNLMEIATISKQENKTRSLVLFSDRLYIKQMNEINAGSKADWNKFNISRMPIYEKCKIKKITLLYLHLLYLHLVYLLYHFL